MPPPSLPEIISKGRRLWSSALAVGGLPRRALRVLSGQGAREGYLAAVDQGAISIANFAATIILARAITPTDLGVYGVGFTALRLVRSVQEGLTIQPINAFGAGMDAESFRRYATSTSLIQIGLALLSSGAVALAGWFLTEMGNDTAGPAMFSLWFVFLFWQLQEYIRRLLYTRSAVFNAVVNTFLANAVRIGLLLWWADRQQINGIAGLNAIAWGSLAALIPGLWQTRRFWTPHFSRLPETWKRNWDFGRWVMGGTIANWISVEFYPVLTAGMISFAAAGAYRALQNLVAPIHLLLRATDTFLTPRAARQFTASGHRALARTLRLVYLVAGLPILGLLSLAVLFPVPILRLLYGETYTAYSSGMVLMAIFYALWFAYWPLQTAFKAARISRPIFIANLSAMAVMFTAGIWAITRWGVYGTIAGQALNALVVAVILWWSWMGVKRAARD
jgi:O-antigen/teichoic acid export membrane protein